MEDFLIRNPSVIATLVDISPRFSGIQRQTLKGFSADYVIADFMELEWNDRLRHLMTSPSLADDESEIIRHFVEDLYKCEYLILMRRAG